MAAKRIQVSSDDTTYYTLPGNSGELSNEAGVLPDTIFGQSFNSSHPGLIGWNVSSNALYKGFAGYEVLMKKSGSATTMTDEAMTLVSGKTYRVTDATKRVLDVDTAIVVKENGVASDWDDVESINYLTGEVTFASAHTPTTPITITGKYLPMTEIAGTRDWTLNMTVATIDDTDIPTARANSGHRTMDPSGLRSVSLEIGGVYKSANAFRAALVARDPIYVEISPDGGGASIARGLFKYTNQGQSGDVGALEEETITLELSVPEDTANYAWKIPFTWIFSSSTLSLGVQAVLNAFLNATGLYVRYLPDGTNGVEGACVVSEVSITGGLDAMNEFSIALAGDGALATYP